MFGHFDDPPPVGKGVHPSLAVVAILYGAPVGVAHLLETGKVTEWIGFVAVADRPAGIVHDRIGPEKVAGVGLVEGDLPSLGGDDLLQIPTLEIGMSLKGELVAVAVSDLDQLAVGVEFIAPAIPH